METQLLSHFPWEHFNHVKNMFFCWSLTFFCVSGTCSLYRSAVACCIRWSCVISRAAPGSWGSILLLYCIGEMRAVQSWHLHSIQQSVSSNAPSLFQALHFCSLHKVFQAKLSLLMSTQKRQHTQLQRKWTSVLLTSKLAQLCVPHYFFCVTLSSNKNDITYSLLSNGILKSYIQMLLIAFPVRHLG